MTGRAPHSGVVDVVVRMGRRRTWIVGFGGIVGLPVTVAVALHMLGDALRSGRRRRTEQLSQQSQ